MKEISIKRIFHDNFVTLGILFIECLPQLVTLERPWLDNQHDISCIPQGAYNVERIKHARFGDTLHVLAVPNRSGILFHSGNSVDDTTGCIILGMSFDCRNEKRMIVDSGLAMRRMRELVGDEEEFRLRITYG